jgi:ubiquinol-cytochrome c reductase cytochrome b subunit
VKRLLDWLDDRSGYRGAAQRALDEPVLGGASFFYVFGSVLLFLLILQMTTGVLLAFYYSPSATDAWGSVAYIQDEVALGWLVRGLHHHGASAMVVVAGLHLVQTAVWGAYKRPRELNWITGVVLLALLLAFALTGYLLPWDQTGYWATKVATGIAGETPIAGDPLQQAAQGGNEYGNLTLTRFYALHVLVLPALTVGLVAIHLALFRRHGVTPSWRRSEAELRARVQPFWPDQLFKDLVAMAVAFAALLGLVWSQGGADLDAPADPASEFDARPEWYFRALFQILKYFEGTLETVAALGVPAIAGAVLLGLPLLDRAASRAPARRILPLGLLAAGVVAAGILTVLSFRQDAADADLTEREAVAEAQARRARALAREHGVPASGGTAVYTTTPHHRARAVWTRECAVCHDGDDRKAPVIGAGYNSRAWIRAFLRAPGDDAFYGRTKIGRSAAAMDAVEASDAELDALVELIYAETGAGDADPALVARGRDLFHGDDLGCPDCHRRLPAPDDAAAPLAPVDAGVASVDTGGGDDEDAEGEDDEGGDDAAADEACAECGDDKPGPVLHRRGTRGYLMRLVLDAGHPDFYGAYDDMDAFEDTLSGQDLDAVVEYLLWLRTASPAEVDAVADAASEP